MDSDDLSRRPTAPSTSPSTSRPATGSATRPSASMPRRLLLGTALAAGVAWLVSGTPASAESARLVPALSGEAAAAGTAATETAVIAGGCFWGVQGVFQHVKGVTRAVSGYAGGNRSTATYEQVGGGNSGHAEAVSVTFDPKQISYAQILQIYFSVAHDPTELNRQGPDVGPQYRSTIFPVDATQAAVARRYIDQLDKDKVFPRRIATTIEPMKVFYPAEAYHQDFLERNPRHPYIVYNDLPKLDELKKLFPQVYQATPVLVSASTQ